ncbi:response regulator [Oryzifoliimicrobium ureilyticus]|uniref:response regulator n=1 Tax=Oryzifoliimicrobium ureilyticus TaxID=3113724 RepID=UPI0030764286
MTSMAAVLVVDDEALIRMALADALSEAGYAVIEASTVLEAVAALALHENIRTVITDVDMPGPLHGLDLARLVASTMPLTQIVVASGHNVHAKDLPLGASFLPKPYNIDALVRDLPRLREKEAEAFRASNVIRLERFVRR